MKKLYTIFYLSMFALSAHAQLSGTGFYRFRNADRTNEYISLSNDKFSHQFLFGTITGGGLSNLVDNTDIIKPLLFSAAEMYMKSDIHMVEDEEGIDPSAILYLSKASGSKYNIIGQGTSLLTLTSGNYVASVRLYFNDLYATVSSSGDYYTSSINIAATGVDNISYNPIKFAIGKSLFLSNAKLGTYYFADDNSIFTINSSSSPLNAKWIIEKVDHLNVKPTIEYQGKYYTTLYTSYAYKLSGKVENAYVVSSIGTDGMLEIGNPIATAGGTVPAGTPVILECSSNVVSECQVIPTGVPLYSAPDDAAKSAPTATTSSDYDGTNILHATYFCNQDEPYTYGKYSSSGTVYSTLNLQNYTKVTNTMYVLGITASGKLGFVKATGTAMPANKAWLEYTGTAELVLPFEEAAFVLGDVNRDRKVTIADVTALVNIILGKATEGDSNNYDFKAANVNEDDDITIADVTALVNMILRK